MNKRSAMFVAAGLVLSLLVAGVSMAMGVTGPSADAKTTVRSQKPIVKTVTRTVTVHKKAKADGTAGPVIVRTTDPTGSTGTSDSESTGDDSYDSEESDSEDDGAEFETEDQPSEDQPSEDQAPEDQAPESDDD